jgi:hypothetical protein
MLLQMLGRTPRKIYLTFAALGPPFSEGAHQRMDREDPGADAADQEPAGDEVVQDFLRMTGFAGQ